MIVLSHFVRIGRAWPGMVGLGRAWSGLVGEPSWGDPQERTIFDEIRGHLLILPFYRALT